MKTSAVRDLMKTWTKRASRGFTLVELMVVVSIIAILAAVSTPTMRKSFRRAQSRDSASKLANIMRNARSQAMSRGEVVLVSVNMNAVNDNDPFVTMRAAPFLTPASPTSGAVTSCRLLEPFNAAFARAATDRPTIPQQIFTRDEVIDPNVGLVGLAPVSNTFVLCFSPSGRIYRTPNQVAEVAYTQCRRGMMLPMGRLQPTATLQNFASTVVGTVDMVCGVAITGNGVATGSAAAGGSLSTDRARVRVAREENYLYFVEITGNGSIQVVH